MNFCTQCGHELGIGRFCTNCGHPVGQPAGDTAERPAVAPVAPPPAHTPPTTSEGSRFPLFADEVDQPDDAPYAEPYAEPRTTTSPLPPLAPTPPPRTRGATHSRRRGALLPWVLGAIVLVLLVLVGGMLLIGGTGEPRVTSGSPSEHPSPASQTPKTGQPTASGKPTDIARSLQVDAPPAAAPNQDVNGNLVRYDATNMLDGVASTCWRTPGDASGETITFTLPRSTVVSEVGLVNGYAKVATDSNGTYDWYRGNRRITAVEWTFDDGTTVRQDLAQTTAMQTVPVDHVVTDTISLRLVSVTPPGKGPASRNYTAISDVDVTGAAAG